MNEADIQRINELARKSKTVEGLTEAELADRQLSVRHISQV